VGFAEVTLHVGLGTFLPVTVENLDDHIMHSEYVEIAAKSWLRIQEAKNRGQKIWSLGTTSTRALESQARGLFTLDKNQEYYRGATQLLIQPGFEFQVVDRLLTNFHQPQSTLLALVSAFANLDQVKACYSWAIERRFKLFSYGDLSVWIK
jgi:S-adenosylmethionine:tRNA ribosyltransferase-isomerase